MRSPLLLLLAALALPVGLHAQKPRERDLRLPIGGTPGPLDAITDVAGVEVGHTTLISGSGKLVVGKGPVRTGLTVVHPRGKANHDPVFAAWFPLNGNGEMTGTTWVQESGSLEGPVAITNTHSVGVVRDAIIQWELSRKNALQPWWLPVVAETYDGGLNDINGFHVKPEHVRAALDGATVTMLPNDPMTPLFRATAQRPKRPSPMRCSPPRRPPGRTTCASTRSRSIGCWQ
jgi:D-aminopeptidase